MLISDVLQSESDIDRQLMYVYVHIYVYIFIGFPGDSVVKNLPANEQDACLIPGSGRSLEEEMATHSSILAWEVPWTGEPGKLQPMGSQKCWT